MNINPMILIRRNPVKKTIMSFDIDNSKYGQLVDLYKMVEKSKSFIIDFLENEFKVNQSGVIINLKRAIFNQQISKIIKIAKNSIILDILSRNEQLKDFIMLIEQVNSKELYLEEVYPLVQKEVRRDMQATVKNSHEISNYLLSINSSIFHKLKDYIDTPIEEHKSKIKKIEGTLYNVITRAALKTSPFLDVTQVGRAVISEESSNRTNELLHHSNRCISLNYTFLYRVAFAYLEKSDLFYQHAKFRLPPFSIIRKEDGSYISYVGTLDDQKSSKIYKSQEVTAELKIPEKLVSLFEDKDITKDIEMKDFEKLFGKSVNSEVLLKLIKRYVEIGLLISTISFDETNDKVLMEDILAKSHDYLSKEESQELFNLFQQLNKLSQNFIFSNAFEKRYFYHKELEEIVKQLNNKFSLTFLSTYVFYEDGILSQDYSINKKLITKYLPDMEILQKFTILFDVNIRLQMEIAERFKLVYHKAIGNIDDNFFNVLFETSKEMQGYWGDATYVKDDVLSKKIKVLDGLKLQFIDEFNQIVGKNEETEVNISSLIKKYVRMIPEEIMNMCDLSSSFFVQYNDENMIINDLYDGHEKYKARFMDYFEEYMRVDVKYLDFIKTYYNDQNYFEYLETFGFNGNAKASKLEKTCYTVGVGNRRFDKAYTINSFEVEDFFVEINDKFKLVDSKGKIIKICHRGSLVPIAMPGYISLLLQLFTSGRMMFSYSQLNKLSYTPRLMFNDIVISREKQRLINLASDIIKGNKETEYEYFRRVNMLFHEKGLAKTFFITADKNFNSTSNSFLMAFKPLYIDIANPIALKVFEKSILSKNDMELFKYLYIEEFLSNDSENVTEYDIEIYKKEAK